MISTSAGGNASIHFGPFKCSPIAAAAAAENDGNSNSSPLLNSHQQQWQLSFVASCAAALSSSSCTFGCLPAAADGTFAGSNGLWHTFLVDGSLRRQQIIPQGFWRQLADSPPRRRCCCCYCLTPSPVDDPLLLHSPNLAPQQIDQRWHGFGVVNQHGEQNNVQMAMATNAPAAITNDQTGKDDRVENDTNAAADIDCGGETDIEVEGVQQSLATSEAEMCIRGGDERATKQQSTSSSCCSSVAEVEILSESFGKMPKLECQEEMEPPGSEPGTENAHPPQLDAAEGRGGAVPVEHRPILTLPKRFFEMAMAVITAHSKRQKGEDGICSHSRHCSLSPSDSSSHSSLDAPTAEKDAQRKGSKRFAGNNERRGGAPLRKRRRVGPRIGPRRKRRGQQQNAIEKQRHNEAEEFGAPLKMALIRAPKQSQVILDGQKAPLTQKRKGGTVHKRAAAAAPLFALVSNWRPIGRGHMRHILPDSRDTFLCFDAIRHRSVPDVIIRIGDCVQINSADSDDDLFVGRVLAIHFDSADLSLQLTLLWFYTRRQLPSAPSDLAQFDPRELFASKHLDSVNVDSVDALIHVLTFAEYCRYRATLALSRLPYVPSAQSMFRQCPQTVSNYPRRDFLPPIGTPSDTVFFCRGVYSLTRKRIISFGCVKPTKSLRGLRPLQTIQNR